MGLKRGFLDRKVPPRTQKSLNWPKNTQNHPQKNHIPLLQGTRRMLHRQSTTLFYKRPYVKLFGLKRGFPDHKVPPDHNASLNWPKKSREKSSPKCHILLFQRTRQLLHWQPTSLFPQMTLSKVIRSEEGISRPQSRSLTTIAT